MPPARPTPRRARPGSQQARDRDARAQRRRDKDAASLWQSLKAERDRKAKTISGTELPDEETATALKAQMARARGYADPFEFVRQPEVPTDAQAIRDATKRKFLLVLGTVAGNIAQACHAVGLSRTQYYDWGRRDPLFAKAVSDLKDAIVDLVEHAHLRSALAGNVVAQIHFLKNRRPDEWREDRKPSGLDKDDALEAAATELREERGAVVEPDRKR